MKLDAAIGWSIFVGAVGLVVYLVLLCRRRIDRIAQSGRSSPREIEKELRPGR